MVRRISFRARADKEIIINTVGELIAILEERTITLLEHIKLVKISKKQALKDLNRHIDRYLEHTAQIKQRLDEVSNYL